MKKLLFLPFLLVAFIFGYYIGVSFSEQGTQSFSVLSGGQNDSSSNFDKIIVDLMVDFQDGQIKSYNNISVDKNYPVFDLLKATFESNEIEFDYDDSGLGVFIKQIGSKENDYTADKYWQYWINGEYAKVGASSYVLQDGDMIEWKYVKGQIEN